MNTDKRHVVVLGMFDGMHLGHLAVFENAKRLGTAEDLPIAAVTFSGTAMLPKFGGRRDVLLMSDGDKTEEMRAFDPSMILTILSESWLGASPADFFESQIKRKLNARFVVCGHDFHFGKDRAGDIHTLDDMCKENGIRLSVVPTAKGGEPYLPISSSRIRELVREGDIPAANELLGHDMYYTLTVEEGRQIGRTMGFPTINQRIPGFMVRPKYGVYASRVNIGGTEYPAVTDIGVKPTVQSDGGEIMETHIIGFDGDLYGKTVRVHLLRYIREERRFDGLDELKAQIRCDSDKALIAFSERFHTHFTLI